VSGLKNEQIFSLLFINKTFFAGDYIGTVSISTDTGATWSMVSTGIPENYGISPLLVSGHYLLAGASPNGVFKSSDDGTSWRDISMGFPANISIFALANNIKGLFCGTDKGIFLSTDSGMTWASSNLGLHSNTKVNIISTISDSNIFINTNEGVFISTDFGTTWNPANNGFMSEAPFVHLDSLIFGASFPFGIYKSEDNGNHWKIIDSTFANPDLIVCGKNVFANNGSYVLRSSDGGSSWDTVYKVAKGNYGLTLYSLFTNGSNLFLSSTVGILWSPDLGISWTNIDCPYCESLVFKDSIIFAIGSAILRRSMNELQKADVQKPTIKASISAVNYPNPATGETTIKISSAERGFVQITIVNMLGEEVAKLYSGELEAGDHSFMWRAKNISAGMYSCVVQVNSNIQIIPIIFRGLK